MTESGSYQREYSRAERWSDACVHLTGIVSVLMAVPVLITLAAVWRGDPVTVVSVVIYGVTLAMMLFCSAAYHMVRIARWRGVLRRMDHTAIFLKIAGTYTAFVLLGGGSLVLLQAIWLAAILGALMKILDPVRYHWAALALYLAMGWAGAFAGDALIGQMSGPGLILILIGGAIYTAGVAFFLWEVLPFHTTIWHLFVLVASGVFYAAVVVELARAPVV
ncbi:MAG: hemolysin III family protein [Pseudomonadota bacterium]